MRRQQASRSRPAVTFIAHSLNLESGGGSNHSLHELACGLSEAGCDVKVITVTPHRNRVRPEAPYEVVEHRLSDTYLSTPKQLWLCLLMFRWQRDADLFHIEAPSLLTAAGLYRTLRGRTPVVARLHSYSWFCSNVSRMNSTCYKTCSAIDRIRHRDESLARKIILSPARLAADVLRRVVIRQVDGIASVSEPASAIERHKGLDAGFHTTLPPIIGDSVINGSNARTSRKHNDGPLSLLYVGRLTLEKGVDLIVRAMDGLRGSAHLDIVGAGPEMSVLVALAERLGVTDVVTFHGWLSQEQVREFYGKAAVFVHAGRWPEPSGRAVVDALASGLPVIVSDVGGPPWIAGDAGLKFRVEDHEDLRQKIEVLVNDRALRLRLANAARSQVSGFGRDEILSRLLSVYGELVPALAGRQNMTKLSRAPEVKHAKR